MIKIQEENFDVAELYDNLCQSNKTGAVAMFVGLVRDFSNKKSEVPNRKSNKESNTKPDKRPNETDCIKDCVFELEHYPGMTEHNLQHIIIEAKKRWSLQDIVIVHRVGKLKIQDQIVFVGVSSSHRAEAFLACDFIMDYLKSRAAFWKKETQADQEGKWVSAKESDEHSLKRWQ